MSRTSTLILLGVLTILAPFSGLPITIRNFLAVVFGAAVAGIGLSIRVRDARNMAARMPTEMPVTPEPETVSEMSSREVPQGVSPI